MSDVDPLKPMVYETPPKYYEPKEYKKLKKKFDYDKEQAEEFAEAITEVNALKARIAQLQSLIEENAEDLKRFMWTTANGVTKAHHQIDDDHLKNILQHLIDTGRAPSKELVAEMESRGISVPTSINQGDNALSIMKMLVEGDPQDIYNWDEIKQVRRRHGF